MLLLCYIWFWLSYVLGALQVLVVSTRLLWILILLCGYVMMLCDLWLCYGHVMCRVFSRFCDLQSLLMLCYVLCVLQVWVVASGYVLILLCGYVIVM